MEFLESLGPVGKVLKVLLILLEVLVVFNFMILIHEWGHFLAARWRGLQVDKFYIWFGKPLWKKTVNGVEYGLGSLPLGGFVALPQMAPQGGIEGEDGDQRESLPPISPLDKIIVAFAGPLFSFLLAVAFAVIVTFVGTPRGKDFTSTIIGAVEKGSTAEKAGLKRGDEILSIDGKELRRFSGPVDSVVWAVVSSEGEKIQFVVKRDGQVLPPIDVVPTKKEQEPGLMSFLFQRPASLPLVGKLVANGPAAEAGVQENDAVQAMDGQPVLSEEHVLELVKSSAGKPVKLTVQRGQQQVDLTMTPRSPDRWEGKLPEDLSEKEKAEFEASQKELRIGIVWERGGQVSVYYPGLWEQISDGFKSMVQTISKVISPRSDLGVSHMSGFLGIVRIYYKLFEQPDAWRWVLAFSVLLNVNLAVMNMLPFPVLDGGHITMALWEGITRRVPGGRVLEVIQTACVLMLLSFMLWVTLKDAGDWFTGGKKQEGPMPVFLPAKERATP
jgi:regulator of sigma E protease